nr:MAG TPA: Protein of unknown function (DUF3102) [Caudoviricetes sp.]
MSTYICKCGQRVQKSSSADNTGNRLKGYGPGHECYGCPYAMPFGGNEWNETAKRFVQDIKGYECRMSRTLSYGSLFIGSTKDKCTCSVFSLDFDFLEQISTWVKDTFSQGELTGGFSRDEIRPTDYSHNGRYCCTFVCAANKKGISAKAALLARFFNPDGNRKGMTPQQEMEKVLTDIRKAKEATECATAQNAGAAATTAENAVLNAATATSTTSENGADASALNQEASPQGCESGPAVLAESFSAGEAVGGTSSPNLTLPANTKTPTAFDYAGLDTQTVDVLHMAESQYSKGKKMAETGLRWMVNAVSMAHDALCGGVVQQLDNSKHGNRGDDSFRAWCESISLSKSSAYNLLRVAERFGNIEVDGKSILDVQPATLLYEAAKPSAPADMVQKVTTCEITSSAEYRAVLKENQQLRTDRVEAMNQADRERARADLAESERDKARADQLSTAKDCNRLGLKVSQEKDRADRAEARAKDAEDALKHQPITGVVDKDEVKRQAEAMSRNAVQEARQQAAEAQARLRQYQEDAEGLLAPAQACAEQAQFIADSVRAMYLKWFGNAAAAGASLAQMGTPLYAVCGEIMSSLEEENTINPTAAGSEEDAEREALFE